MSQRRIFRVYTGIFAVLMLGWWPASHWLFPDTYHDLLGFGQLTASDYAMAKVIGTLSVLPVLGMLLVARDPERLRGLFISLLVLSALTVGTYTHLIETGDFPDGEWLNVGLITLNGLILAGLYPWRSAQKFQLAWREAFTAHS